MRRRVKLADDTWWSEVETLNNYALFMGYLSMAVNGMGFLVLTWTTVVLLGGFVSDLHNKDFWCLTFITLVQTAGIFDVFLTEKLNYIGYSLLGVASVGYPAQRNKNRFRSALSMVHVVLFGILLCPLVVVYNCGLFIAAGISVWRLVQHDYHADGVRNLKPALDVLYSLALVQGVIFCYKCINGFAKGNVVDLVAKSVKFDEQSRVGLSEYVLEMMAGCQKDRLYTRGRNIITYAVDLMGSSKSPDDYMSGLRILDTCALRTGNAHEYGKGYLQWNTQKKHLIMSPKILPKLLQTLGRTSIYDRETRGHAARVVASIADDIHLEELPGAIRYISSLIDTFEKYRVLQPCEANWLYEKEHGESYEEERGQIYREERHESFLKVHAGQEDDATNADVLKAYADLVEQGFLILQKLATSDDNCKVMLATPCLLPKIMAPVTSDLLHPRRGDKNVHINHGQWYSILEGSLKVIVQLAAAKGKTGAMLRSEISSSKEGVTTMDRILECGECHERLKKQVIWILAHLHRDTSWTPQSGSRQKFIERLVQIMVGADKCKEDTRVIAANALVDLSSKTKTDATVIMKTNDNVVDNLKTMLLEKRMYRSVTAEILEYLCIHYTDDDEILRELRKAMADAVPKLVEEIICWATETTHTGTKCGQVSLPEEIHTGTKAKRASLRIPENDIENQPDYSQGIGQGINSSCSQDEMNKYVVFRMLSLCVTVCETFFSADQFDAITKGGGPLSFPVKLKLIVEKCLHPMPDCLRILKPTCKTVIWMMKNRCIYDKRELESLMDALSRASEVMFLIDGSIIFDNQNDYTTTPKTFDSLVNEAHILMMNQL